MIKPFEWRHDFNQIDIQWSRRETSTLLISFRTVNTISYYLDIDTSLCVIRLFHVSEYQLAFVKFVQLEIFSLRSLQSILHIARSKDAWLGRRFYDPSKASDFHVARSLLNTVTDVISLFVATGRDFKWKCSIFFLICAKSMLEALNICLYLLECSYTFCSGFWCKINTL